MLNRTDSDQPLPALLALISGLAAVGAFAPFGYVWLMPVSLFGLFLSWRNTNPRQGYMRGLLYGIGLFGAGVYWVYISVHLYGHAPLPLALFVMALLILFLAQFPAMLGWLAGRGADSPWGLLLTLPAGWVLLELLRGWLFTGFPWLSAGYSQIDSPLAAFAPVTGVYAISGLCALTAGALLTLVVGRSTGRLASLVILIALAGGSWSLSQRSWSQAVDEAVRVALIQGNIPQDQKWEPAQRSATLQRYHEQSLREWTEQPTDVVIWPESAIPAFLHEVADLFIPALAAQAGEQGTDLVVGVPVLDRQNWQYYNALLAIGGNNALYYKQHLVPFGEYLPLRDWVDDLLQVIQLPVADFSAGEANQTLLEVGGHPVGSSICYEIIFGREIAATAGRAAWLLNVSNDAWFGDSLAPHQHLEMARMRALETGRDLVRATNTGISAIIRADGNVVERGPQFETTVVRGEVIPREGITPYVRYGDLPVLVVAAMLFLVGLIMQRRKPRKYPKL